MQQQRIIYPVSTFLFDQNLVPYFFVLLMSPKSLIGQKIRHN